MEKRTFSWFDDLVGAAICLGAGAWVYMDLLSLERGEVESVKVWAPLAFLYNHFGFYPSTLALPLFGTGLIISAVRKRRAVASVKDAGQ